MAEAAPLEASDEADKGTWLLFGASSVAPAFASLLTSAGHEVVTVRAGGAYAASGRDVTINPEQAGD